LKIGLIGVGYLGKRHLQQLLNLENIKISAIFDIDTITCKKIGSEFGVKVADNLEDLLNSVDAVDIVTPTSTHFEVAKLAINKDKHLFIEKPICTSIDEGRELVEMAEAKNLLLQVGHIERFNRARRSLDMIDFNPRFIEAHRLALWNPRGVDVAVVHDLMIHDLDLILSVNDSEVKIIHANGVAVISDSVDIATARIEFVDGMVANVTASRISLKNMRKMRLFGGREYIALDLLKGECEFVGVADEVDGVPDGFHPLGDLAVDDRRRVVYRKFLKATEGDALRLELTAFRDSVVNNTPAVVSGRDGLRALELAERIVTIIRDNK